MTDETTETHVGGQHADRPPFPAVAEEVASWYDGDSTGHDMHHAWRVFALGTRIAEAEDADLEVVGGAALVHDLHRAMADEGEFVHPAETLAEVRTVLQRAGFPDEKVPDVCHCVEVHDEYEYRGDDRLPETLEAEIVRDADNLDAMGAVGIARDFAFTGVAGNPLWDPEGEEYSGIEHFHDKLLKLREEMHTETARELAAGRHAFLEEFLDRFEREWYGDA